MSNENNKNAALNTFSSMMKHSPNPSVYDGHPTAASISDFDPSDSAKDVKNYEELFDSGYNSNVQSKTFLDIEENELDQLNQSSHRPAQEEDEEESTTTTTFLLPSLKKPQTIRKNDTKFDSVQQWTDSGVCITDSGLSIVDDENDEPIYLNDDNRPLIDDDHASNKTKPVSDGAADPAKNLLAFWLRSNCNETLLHLAIIEGLEDVACSIIQNVSTSSEMLSSYNYLYQTPLHLAVLKRQMNVIQHLLVKGVSITFQDSLGNTPLHIACRYSLNDIVQLILSTAPKSSLLKCFDIRNYDGDTCLHLATYRSDSRLLELLFMSGANINLQEGKSGKTILHWAIENLQVQLVQFLLNYNADIQAKTFADKTPLYYILKQSAKNDLAAQTKTKINKIIRMSIEYCNEHQLSLEQINDVSSDTDSSEEDEI